MVKKAQEEEPLVDIEPPPPKVTSAVLIRRKKGSRKSEVHNFTDNLAEVLDYAAASAGNGYAYVEIHVNGQCFALSR